MKINKENYGRFIVDYYDGQLSPEEERLLMLFLDQHPALKEEFESFKEVPVLPDEPLEFSEKQSLQKIEIAAVGAVNEDNYSEYFVLLMDDELTREEQHSVKIFLQQNPQLQGQFRLFGMTKVAPDESIVFDRKEYLHKRRVIPLIRYAGMAVAAVLLLFLGIRFFLSTPEQKTESKQLAVESIPLKTTKIAVREIPPRLIRKKVPGTINNPKAVKKNIPVTILKPVEMLASADIYMPLKRKKDYAPLLFPNTREQEEIMALSLPVVVEKPKRNNFLRHTIGRPFSQLAAVFALQKRKRRATGVHDKGFVKVLQSGVEAMNALTDNDMVMVKTYDANGNLIDYQLLSDNFSINRPVREKRSR
jgi:hypothetical protein